MNTVKFSNLLIEGISGSKLIVVNIQPAFEKYFKNFKLKFLEDLVNYKGKVLYLYNGPDLGYSDDEFQIEQWIREETGEWDIDLSHIEFVEKGYGFFRDAMDQGYDEDDIAKLVSWMLKHKKYDSRDIDDDVLPTIIDDENFVQELQDENISVGIPGFDLKVLKRYSGASICGGGKEECLAEVLILLDAMNIKTKQINKYIY